MKVELIPFSKCINKDLFEMYQDIPEKEIGSVNNFFGLSFDEFKKKCNEYVLEETKVNPEINTTTKRYILCISKR